MATAADAVVGTSHHLQLYGKAAADFRKRLLRGMTPGLREALLAAADLDAVQELLFPYFAEFALATYPKEIAAYR